MLRITFLGTCGGGVPSVTRGMPSIAVKYERQLMLWDCGEGTQRQLMKYKVGYGSVNAIFVTHPHLDHYLGMYGLLETLKLSSPSPKPVKLFLPGNISTRDFSFVTSSKIRKGKLYSGKGFVISAFPVKHCQSSYGLIFQEDEKIKFNEKKAHSLGLKGKLFTEIQKKGFVKTEKGKIKLDDVTWIKPGRKIVYSGDTMSDEGLIEYAKGADLLIHEGTFDESMKEEAAEKKHSTVVDAATIARKAKVKRLIITHISSRYSDQDLLLKQAKKIFSNTEIAKDGLVINL